MHTTRPHRGPSWCPLLLLAVIALATGGCSDVDLDITFAGSGDASPVAQDAVAEVPDAQADSSPPQPDAAGPSDVAEIADMPSPDAAADVAATEDSADPAADTTTTGFSYLVVEPEALDFGAQPVGEVITTDLELENAGNTQLTLTSITFVDGSEAFASNASQTFLGPGQKKVVKVTFYALEAGTTYSDVLRFESNSVAGAQLDVSVVGVVVAPSCDDLDGDGHGAGCAAGSDCDESDPLVHVGAPEACNGQDDDCDGLHDEDWVGLGDACIAGTGGCTTEGFKVCGQGGLVCSVNPVTGGSELCNLVDDDCDGLTDEDFPSIGKLCWVGKGACAAFDKYVCSEDGTTLVCNVTPGEPGEEICGDGVDNDCDGVVDEGELEVCGDGIDNDCDGETDESGSAWGEVFFARSWYGDTVAIYPSHGDGTFAEPIPLVWPDDNRYGVYAVGDFSGDGWLDLLVRRTVVGDQTICATKADCPAGYRCAGVCRKLCTSDSDCDAEALEQCIDHSNNGATDDTYCDPPADVFLAVSSCAGDDIALSWLFTVFPGERVGPVIDTDGNGHLDVVGLDHWSTPTGFTWLNNGQGGFDRVPDTLDYSGLITWSYGLARTSKDLDGDGHVDLLGYRFDNGGSPPGRLFLFRGQGDGSFAAPQELTKKVPYPANLITANDFDGDGDHDVVAGLDDDGQPGNVWMLLNLDDPGGDSWVDAYSIFDVVPLYNSGGEHPGVGNGTSFDFDGDHLPDVLAAWTPEECGSYVWGCTSINDPAHICYGGSCRKVAFFRNRTATACVAGTSCIDGQCQVGCEPDCSGKLCGGDGCSGTCGVCGGGQTCAGGQCVVDCVPKCEGKQCGDNGCGGTCGDCPQGESCLSGQCVAGCVPSCAGKTCGDDGCGGSCAVFDPPQIVEFSDNPSTYLAVPTNVPPTTPALAILPEEPTTDDALICAITAESFDTDEVVYRYRWFRGEAFVAEVGDAADVPETLTEPGDTWTCRVRATDGIEWSPEVEATATIAPGLP